jgi:uncharacterized protein (TIGR03437 family)
MRNTVKVASLFSVLFIAGLLFCAPAAQAAEPDSPPAALQKGRVSKRNIVAQQEPCSRYIAINAGADVTGRLDTSDCRLSDDSFADYFVFNGVGGQQIAISYSSAAFDAYLMLLDANGIIVEENDDGGGGSNARIPASTGFLTLPATGIYVIVANSFEAGVTGDYTLRLTTTGAIPPAVVSTASFSGTQLAPNSVASIFGTNLALGTAAATSLPLPTTLAGTRVDIVSGSVTTPAQLFFASPGQINFLLPAGIASGAARVRITNSAGATGEAITVIARIAPGLFTANANGQGVPAAVAVRIAAGGTQTTEAIAQFNQATQRFVATPINLGPVGETVVLVLYGTGFRGRNALNNVRVTIGGLNAEVLFAGEAPGFVGLDQLNVVIPRAVAGRGEVDVVLTVESRRANLTLTPDNRLDSTVRVRIQ